MIYSQISSNVWRTALLMVFFVALVVGVAYVFSLHWNLGPWGMLAAFAVALIWSMTSYFYGDKIVLASTHARRVESPEQNRRLWDTVEGLSIAGGVPMPKIYVIDDPAPNAFATGRSPLTASIAVTTGLLEKMEKVELEGVIGHELSHIRNYDIRLMVIAAVMVGAVALMADWMWRSMFWGGGRKRGGNAIVALIAIVMVILAPLAAQLMQLALSRRREYLADASGALLTRYPEGLASALEKIAVDPTPLHCANKATAHLFIWNPLREHKGWLNSLFNTHPPIEDRIRRLREM